MENENQTKQPIKIIGAQQGKRYFICGKTGTGKTTYAIRNILVNCDKHILVIDVKRCDDLLQLLLNETPHRIYLTDNIDYAIKNLPNYHIVIYRPRFKKNNDFYNVVDDALYTVFNRVRNICLYLDETMLLKNGVGLQALYTQGRSLKIDIVACTQRPFVTPTVCKSQSDYFYIFKIVMNSDIKELSKMLSISDDDIKNLEPFNFIYQEL